MAMLSLAHIFTGLSPDIGSIRPGLLKKAFSAKRRPAKQNRHSDVVCHSSILPSPTTTESAQQKWLQEEEDDRWLQVEGGSPKKWRSCRGCAFLSDADEPVCEVCGIPASPSSAQTDHLTLDDEETDAAQTPSRSDQGCMCTRQDREPTSPSLQEVVIAHNAPLPEEKDQVSRHNVALVVFRAFLHGREEHSWDDRLRLADLERFSLAVAAHAHWDRYARRRRPIDVAAEYGWDATLGTAFCDFFNCIDDDEGDWYCSTAGLWSVLATLDRQGHLLGDRSHTRKAILLGTAPLEHAPLDALEVQPQEVAAPPAAATKVEDATLTKCPDDVARSCGETARQNAEVESPKVFSKDDQDNDDSDEETDSDAETIAGTLDEAPPVGSAVKVLYNDGVWHMARVLKSKGTLVEVVFDDGEYDKFDVAEHACRMADYMSDDENCSESGSEKADTERCLEEPDEKRPADEASEDGKSDEGSESESGSVTDSDDEASDDSDCSDETSSEEGESDVDEARVVEAQAGQEISACDGEELPIDQSVKRYEL